MVRVLLIFGMLILSGCQTALVYTGTVSGPRPTVLTVAQSLEDFYLSRGLSRAPAIRGHGHEEGEWHLVRKGHAVLWLGHTVKEEKIEIRIVPQPGANEASREVAAAIRAFMAGSHPDVRFVLVEKPELDLFR